MYYQVSEEKSGGRRAGSEGKPSDPDGTRERVKAALSRHAAGEALTEREWTIVQYALGGGCHACGGRAAVKVVVRRPDAG